MWMHIEMFDGGGLVQKSLRWFAVIALWRMQAFKFIATSIIARMMVTQAGYEEGMRELMWAGCFEHLK